MALKNLSIPLRTLLTKTNIGGPLAAFSNKLSSNAKPPPTAMYELRVYRCPPGNLAKVLQLFEENIQHRTKYSILLGFWTAEIGESIAQLVHFWGYDSLSQRREQRALSNKDENFGPFRQEVIPYMEIMTNALVIPAPGTTINVDFVNEPTAVYELQTMEQEDGPVKADGDKEILVGRFYGVLGPTKTEYRLWRYTDIDAMFTASSKRALENPQEGTSMLMYPTGYSPIQ